MATVCKETSASVGGGAGGALVFPPQPLPNPYTTTRSTTPAALIVLLAAQPSTEAGPVSPRRQWSSQREVKSAPNSARRVEKSVSLDGESAVSGFFQSQRKSMETIEQEPECCSASEDHPSPLPTKGLIRKFRKRILSTDKSSSSSSSSSANGNNHCCNSGSLSNRETSNVVQACNSYSPRQRPLFVDTQMANMDTMKRRSPVSQVVDFVRGRNRTYSLQLSSSPMSPQSVAARASASCDTQPAGIISNSPGGRRQTVSGRVHRASFTASGALKSFDSGLDLSSPTINHTALLIKEVCPFPSLFHENHMTGSEIGIAACACVSIE